MNNIHCKAYMKFFFTTKSFILSCIDKFNREQLLHVSNHASSIPGEKRYIRVDKKRARRANSRRVESFLLRSTVVVPFFRGALTTTPEPS